ncbi:MAG: hypothetical protein ACXV5Q_00720 [Frankiaceae bacterium]
MDLVTKDFPVTAGEPTEQYPHGSFEVILSAPTLDRDGEVVDSKAFEPLPPHITFDTDHSMTCDSVVGSGVPSYAEDGTLRVKGGYCSDERSQIIRQKVAEGHIRTTSVTFMAATRTKDAKGVDHVTQAELLNGTFTPVPSNRESVVLSAKSIVAKEGRRNSKTDAEQIQMAHDAMTALGASCAAKSVGSAVGGKGVTPDALKSIVGSLEAARDRAADALEDAYGVDGSRWVYLRGVLPATLVFDVYDTSAGECTTYQQSYTDDGSVTTLTGTATEVDVMEVVVPDADAFRETDDFLKSTAPATVEATGTPAAAIAAKAADEDAEIRARMSVIENAARFAFGS